MSAGILLSSWDVSAGVGARASTRGSSIWASRRRDGSLSSRFLGFT